MILSVLSSVDTTEWPLQDAFFQDSARSGRPVTAATQETADVVKTTMSRIATAVR